MNGLRDTATYLLALSLFSLAGALVYFTIELANISNTISKELPDVLTSVNQTSKAIEPVVKEIGEIRELVPSVLNEVSETRKQIPPILDEVKQVREQIPAILEEVKQVREQIPPVLEEVRQTRPLIPKVLDEVAKTREALPGLLEKGEKVVSGAQKAGEKASEGAVTGFFKGIITLPFKIIGGIGQALFSFNEEVKKDLSESDIEQLKQLSREMLLLEEIGAYKEWKNDSIGYTGKIILKSIEVRNEQPCKTINLKLWEQGKAAADTVTTFCQTPDGNWLELK